MIWELNRWLGTFVYIALVCPSAREDELDKRRDSSFFYSRKAGFQQYRGICLCGNGLLSICGDAFVRERDFAFFTGPRDTGYGISHFARDHGIKIPNPVQSRGKNPAGRSEKDRIDLIFSDQKKTNRFHFSPNTRRTAPSRADHDRDGRTPVSYGAIMLLWTLILHTSFSQCIKPRSPAQRKITFDSSKKKGSKTQDYFR